MSDFDDKLNALLSDSDRMAQIMQLAQTLSGGNAAEAPPQATETTDAPPADDWFSSLSGNLDPKLLLRLMPLVQELGSDNNSHARTLLYALRPYLKQERQERIERALQLAKLLRLGKKFFKEWEGSGV